MVRYNLLHSLSMTNATTRTCTRAGWLMIALEAWAFDVGQILAAYLDVVSLGAHSALQTLTGFTYMSFPLALSIAVSIRVGHLLGSGDYRQAQVAMRATVMLTTCFMVMIALTMLILRDFLGYVFSNDEAVVSTFAAIIPIAAFFQVFPSNRAGRDPCCRWETEEGETRVGLTLQPLLPASNPSHSVFNPFVKPQPFLPPPALSKTRKLNPHTLSALVAITAPPQVHP